MKRSHVIAGGVVLAIGAWMLSGQFSDDAPKAHNNEPETTPARVKVRGEIITAQPHPGEAVIRGRTEASRKVDLRARVQGHVAALPFLQGSEVKKGDLICKLTVDARGANAEEARALVASRRLDYNAAEELARNYVASFDTSRAGGTVRPVRWRLQRLRWTPLRPRSSVRRSPCRTSTSPPPLTA